MDQIGLEFIRVIGVTNLNTRTKNNYVLSYGRNLSSSLLVIYRLMKTFTNYIPTDSIWNEMPKNLVMHSDGVGSKCSLAWEKLQTLALNGLVQDALAMNFNDMTIIGCHGPWLYNNTIHLHPNLAHIAQKIRDMFKTYDEIYGFKCLGGETCITDRVSDILIDVTMLSGLDEPKWDLSSVVKNDIVYGWKQGIGPGSNGFTFIRPRFNSLSDEAKDQVLESTPFFYPEVYGLDKMKALIHCTSDGLFKSERWGIFIEFGWNIIEWPLWVRELHDISGMKYESLMHEINGGYQMIAIGPLEPRLDGWGWDKLGVVSSVRQD